LLLKFKKELIANAKNLIGWRTGRKIVVISVDDYGNVRVDSSKARERMNKAGLKVRNRFDAYDAMETREDLEHLFDVRSSVKDRNGRHAVFTPFAVSCNIDFEQMADEGYERYIGEPLPETFNKLSALQPAAYEGTWGLLKEGISKGVLAPQFHGREHINLNVFEERLGNKDQELLAALANRSYTSISVKKSTPVSNMSAFDFWNFNENERFKKVIRDGLDVFEKVYGYRSNYFNPPGGIVHPVLFDELKNNGVAFMDMPLIKKEHQGEGKYTTKFYFTGKVNWLGQTFLVRNVVFEPTEDRGIDWIEYSLKQIETAFRWSRPAIISSHRVNFCGHIEPANRRKGLDALGGLLSAITRRWPEVELLAASELAELVSNRDK